MKSGFSGFITRIPLRFIRATLAVDTQPAVGRNKPAPAGVSGKPTGQMPEYAQHIFRTKTMWCIA